MARLNTRPSTVASSRYPSTTPGPPDPSSDQENRDPSEPAARSKGKQRAMGPPPSRNSLPTLDSHGSGGRGQKRKRPSAAAGAIRSESEALRDDEDRFNRYYDPKQDPEERRDVKRQMRDLEREFRECRDDLLKSTGTELNDCIKRANQLFEEVKQTSDATLDSRLLVEVSDLAEKKAAQLVVSDGTTGLDLDEFVSKCISYMRADAPASRRRRTRDADSDDEDEDPAESLDWEVLGRHACMPYTSRPCLPSFLLGPLSVEKKVRTQTQRRARQAPDRGPESRPEALSREHLSQTDENGLTAVCKRIHAHLKQHCHRAEKALSAAGIDTREKLHSERGKAKLRELRLTSTGGPSLFDYVLNPRSFGQTVENLFYVSFLIKEGAVGVGSDEDGLPTLNVVGVQTDSEGGKRRKDTAKHQAVMALDYTTWERLCRAFEVREPLIPHRAEEGEDMGGRGWY